jgi:hypothetical protein
VSDEPVMHYEGVLALPAGPEDGPACGAAALPWTDRIWNRPDRTTCSGCLAVLRLARDRRGETDPMDEPPGEGVNTEAANDGRHAHVVVDEDTYFALLDEHHAAGRGLAPDLQAHFHAAAERALTRSVLRNRRHG